MIRVDRPEYKQDEIVEACAHNIRSGKRRDGILSSKKAIIDGSLNYNELATAGRLSMIEVHDTLLGGATKNDMVWLYDNKFVKEGGKKYYDRIKLLPINGICPICGKRKVSTLDHYLPKSKYPLYAVTPYNLVAVCSDCNKEKSNSVVKSREEETIHPYYDDFDDVTWIRAEILKGKPIGFHFSVFKPEKWCTEKFKRAQNHFIKFKLNELYVAYAGDLIGPYRIQLAKLYQKRGVDAIKEDLADRMESYGAIRLNSLETVLYAALLNNKWFLESYIPELSRSNSFSIA